jgi:hypothetical protein
MPRLLALSFAVAIALASPAIAGADEDIERTRICPSRLCPSRAPQPGVEIDHRQPLALGGADTIANLWPRPRDTAPWNAEKKDEFEYQAVVAPAIATR